MAESHLHDNAPHLTATEARQGFRGRHILMVLIISVALAAIALAASWGFKSHDLKAAGASEASRQVDGQTMRPNSQPSITTPSPVNPAQQ